MRPTTSSRWFFLIGVAVCLAVSAAAYLWATQLIDGLYDYRSPLSGRAPAPAEPFAQPLTRRLVFVLIDGLREDTALRADVMPVLDSLRQAGASARMHSRTPTYSQPSYGVLLTGAWPDLSDGPAFNVDLEDIPPFSQDNLFSAAQRAGLDTAVSAYYWFERLLPADAVRVSFYTAGEDQAADRAVVDAALPWLTEGRDALLLIHIDQVDYAGHHEGGAVSPAWDAAARRSDELLGEVLARLDLSQDTVLVLSDHGHIDAGGHGGQDAAVTVEPFVLAGAGIRPGRYADLQMVDVAPTVAVLLGTNLPASAEGRPLVEMLALNGPQTDAVSAAWDTQQSGLLSAYSAAIGQPDKASGGSSAERLAGLRASQQQQGLLARAALGLLALAAGLFGLTRLPRVELGGLALGSALYLAFFHLRYAGLDRRTYSFSSIEGATQLVVYCAVTVAIALTLAWLALMLSGRVFQQGAGAAAGRTLRWVLTLLGVLAVPVLVSFVLNGPWAGNGVLPEPLSYYMALLSLIQILLVALIGLILTGISALAARRPAASQ